MANIFTSLRRGAPTIDIPAVVVIGLGRFGSSLANELVTHGVEVFGIDADEKILRAHAPYLTDAASADTTDPEALRQLGIDEVERVVLAIGGHLEASILTASNLVDMGVADIWAKANSEAHEKILRQIGVHHVVHPERDTGRRVAHLLGGRFREFAEIAADYGVTRMAVPGALVGQPLALDYIWSSRQVQLVSVRQGDGRWVPLHDGMILSATDFVVAAGSPAALEEFSKWNKAPIGLGQMRRLPHWSEAWENIGRQIPPN